MPGHNAELMRAAIEAVNRGDVDALLELVDVDGEWVTVRGRLEGTTYRGHDGVREAMRGLGEDFEGVRLEDARFTERGDRVIACGRYRARGASSGVEVDMPIAYVAQVRDGKIARLDAYSDLAEALGASEAQGPGPP